MLLTLNKFRPPPRTEMPLISFLGHHLAECTWLNQLMNAWLMLAKDSLSAAGSRRAELRLAARSLCGA
jgi:hypothetical protein